jgi:hypothetical protein
VESAEEDNAAPIDSAGLHNARRDFSDGNDVFCGKPASSVLSSTTNSDDVFFISYHAPVTGIEPA